MMHVFERIGMLDGIYCNEPESIRGRKCPEDCQCIKRPSNETYVVTCRNIFTLPLFLPDPSEPPPREAKFMLEFGDSSVSIPVLEYRDYFNNTISLNVGSSGVKNVTDEAWRAFFKFEFIYVGLSNNKLTSLPTILMTENLTFRNPRRQQLALGGNPFLCACEDRWMRDWLLSLGEALYQPKSVLCDNPDSSSAVRGKNVLQVTDEQFCYDPKSEIFMIIYKAVIPAVFSSLLLVGLVISLLYRFRVKAYAKLNIHPFDRDECEGEDMTHDIFLSCANEDSDVARWILDRLERHRCDRNANTSTNARYKVCYHERDFHPGARITENIQLAIERSRRVVCLLTRHFLESPFCVMEFCGAWSHHLQINKRRLIVIKWPDVEVSEIDVNQQQQQLIDVNSQTPAENDVASVKLFLSTHTYIEYGSDSWWNQLMYSLPTNSLPSVVDSADHNLPADEGHASDTEQQTEDDDDQLILLCTPPPR